MGKGYHFWGHLEIPLILSSGINQGVAAMVFAVDVCIQFLSIKHSSWMVGGFFFYQEAVCSYFEIHVPLVCAWCTPRKTNGWFTSKSPLH